MATKYRRGQEGRVIKKGAAALQPLFYLELGSACWARTGDPLIDSISENRDQLALGFFITASPFCQGSTVCINSAFRLLALGSL